MRTADHASHVRYHTQQPHQDVGVEKMAVDDIRLELSNQPAQLPQAPYDGQRVPRHIQIDRSYPDIARFDSRIAMKPNQYHLVSQGHKVIRQVDHNAFSSANSHVGHNQQDPHEWDPPVIPNHILMN